MIKRLLLIVFVFQSNFLIAQIKMDKRFKLNFRSQSNKHSTNEYAKLIYQKITHKNIIKIKLAESTTDEQNNTHQKFQLYYKGIKLEHATIIVHSKDGTIVSIEGENPLFKSMNTNPILTESEAFQIAKNSAHSKKFAWQDSIRENALKNQTRNLKATYFPKGELVFCPITDNENTSFGDYILSYKFDIYSIDPISRAYIYINAFDGGLVLQDAILKHANEIGTAATRYNGTKTIYTESTNGYYRLHDNTRGGGIRTLGQDSVNNIYEFKDNDNNWSSAEFNNAKFDNAALDVHWAASLNYDYWKSIHGRNSFDNLNAPILSYVHFDSTGLKNAFWDGVSMNFGDGAGKPYTSLDICGHEFGHAITQYTCNLIYLNESGAINESLSDIWGACLEYHTDSTKNTWQIGEDLYSGNNYLRAMDFPKNKKQPNTYKGVNWYTGTLDYGGVHTNSGVMNYWFFLITKGGSGVNDNWDNYSISPIGIEKSASIVYQASRFYLTSSSQYQEARQAMISAAIDLYGIGSNEVIQTSNAWDAVGVYDTQFAPSSLVATATSQTSVLLSWSDNSSGELGYIIQRAKAFQGQVYTNIDTVASNSSTYNDLSLVSNSGYFYRVSALFPYYKSKYDTASVYIGNPPTIMRNATYTTCGTTLLDPGGLGNVPTSSTTVTTLKPGILGNSIKIDFKDLDMSTPIQLSIFDGANEYAPLIGIFYNNPYIYYKGINSPIIASNSSGSLTIKLVNSFAKWGGFQASVTCVSPEFVETNSINETLIMGESVWVDYDSDNDLDLFVCGSDKTTLSGTASTQLFRNDNGKMVKSNTPFLNLAYSSADWGDYDNDGDLDLAIAGTTTLGTGTPVTQIYNNNQGSFTLENENLLDIYAGTVKWVDVDNDGKLDLFLSGSISSSTYLKNPVSKIYKYNNGQFVDMNSALPGTGIYGASWADYDNDGDMDVFLRINPIPLLFSAPTSGPYFELYKNDKGTFSKDLNSGVNSSNKIHNINWGDYDNDGDLDMLASSSVAYSPNGFSKIEVLENNNGFFGTSILIDTFSACLTPKFLDFDSDGDLDIVLSTWSKYYYPLNKYNGVARETFVEIYLNTNGLYSKYEVGAIPGSINGNINFADYDLDGDLDLYLSGCAFSNSKGITTYSHADIFENKINKVNTNPTPPSGLTSLVTGGNVTLNWSKATDAETSQNGLSYNIRVGTSPASSNPTDGIQIIAPMSNTSNGFRKVGGLGNAGMYTKSGNYIVNCLPNGTYYWSVQTIDNGFKSSTFALEQTFTISQTNPYFDTLYPNNLSLQVSDSTNLIMHFNEPMYKGKGIITLRKILSDSIVESFDVASSPLISIYNSTITINPTINMEPGAGYYVEVPDSAFINTPCNKLMSVGTDKTSWNFKISKLNQHIVFTDDLSKSNIQDIYFPLNAISSSGLPIVYSISDSSIAIIRNDTVFFMKNGMAKITAYQNGDSRYSAATPVSVDLVIGIITSKNFNLKDEISLSPNPSTDFVVISTKPLISDSKIEISDILGRKRASFEIYPNIDGKYTLDIKQLEPGMYTVRIPFKNSNISMQLVKQ